MLLLAAFPGSVVSQTTPQVDAVFEIEKLLSHIETGMRNSDVQIQQGNYSQAQADTDVSIASLSILLNLFMPLPERIKMIWEKEKDIVSQTKTLSGTMDSIVKTSPTDLEALVTTQRENIERTQQTVDSIAQQLQQAKISQNQKHQGRDQAINKELQPQIDLLSQVGDLLQQAKTHQDDAVDHLTRRDAEPALQSEIAAVGKLKEALDVFQQDQKQNKQQQQQNNQSPQDSQKNPSQNQNQDQQNRSKQPNQDSAQSKTQSETTPNQEKKLTSKEALQELFRLRKEADAEKRRREKAIGKQVVPGRTPIEKDW